MKLKQLMLYCCCLCALCACSKEEQATELSPAKITLGVRAEQTRAAANTLSDLAKLGDRIGIYGIVDWSEPAVMRNVQTTKIDAQTGALQWEGAYYYPYHQDVRFYSYYPYASNDETNGNYMEELIGASPILHFTITGEEDLMYADPVIGSDQTPPASLGYNHLLTQFHFVLIDEGDFHEAQIERITFTDVNTYSTLFIEDGKLGDWSNPQHILFPSSYPVQITGTADSPQNISGSIMLQPGLQKYYLEIVVTGKGTFSNVCITPWNEPVFVAGCSYEITLKFNKEESSGGPGDGDGDGGDDGDGGEIGVEIKASAWVTPWKEGGSGSGQIGE